MGKRDSTHAPLSSRKIRCLKLIASGKRYDEAAEELSMTTGTLKSYVSRIKIQLGTRTLAQTIKKACDLGILG